MLRADAAKLRWLGVDMRPRWRRRVAVVVTYGVYMALMGGVPIRGFLYGREVMWVASLGMTMVGLFGFKGPVKLFDGGYETEMPDERELSERNRASHLTLRFLATMFLCGAMGFTHGRVRHQPDDLIGMMLTYMVIALTLPKAIVLWTEVDPRMGGEMELVRS